MIKDDPQSEISDGFKIIVMRISPKDRDDVSPMCSCKVDLK